MEIIQYIESQLEIQDDVHYVSSRWTIADSLADPMGVHSRGVTFYLLVSQLCKNFQQWS